MRRFLSLLAALLICAVPAWGGEFDYEGFARNEVLTSLHSTAKPEEARAEIEKGPVEEEGGKFNSARVRVSYKGWTQEHELVADVNLMGTAVGTMARVEVLSDTNAVKADILKDAKYAHWHLVEGYGECPAAPSEPLKDFDFLAFARKEALPSLHPTSDEGEAKVELDKDPVESDGIISARVRVFYKGWMKRHEMLMDISAVSTPAGPMVKVEVLKDTNALSADALLEAKYSSWQLLEAE